MKSHHYIKWSPIHLYNYYPTIQIAYEYKLNHRFGLQTEAGYILPYSIFSADTDGLRGVKLQEEFRFYFAGTPQKQQHYLSFETYLNRASFKREAFEIECFDLECQQTYQRRYFYRVRYKEEGLTFKYGLTWYWSRFTLDMNWGLRLRNIRYDKPRFNEDDDWSLFHSNEETRRMLLPITGFRVGWRIY